MRLRAVDPVVAELVLISVAIVAAVVASLYLYQLLGAWSPKGAEVEVIATASPAYTGGGVWAYTVDIKIYCTGDACTSYQVADIKYKVVNRLTTCGPTGCPEASPPMPPTNKYLSKGVTQISFTAYSRSPVTDIVVTITLSTPYGYQQVVKTISV